MDCNIELAIQRLLKKKIGLDTNTLGSSKAIEKAVSDRMRDCEIFDIPTYLNHLQSSPQEWDALIEKVIVPETWFFRDLESFNFLRQYIVSEWLPNKSLQGLRVLSVPCSSGEEPYSIAMTLLEAGLNPNQFRIDAVDVSKFSLLKAKRGIYGKHSFRGENFASPNSPGFALRKRYFESTSEAEKYELCQLVKSTVSLKFGNLVEPLVVPSLSKDYQIIFCRNLLIYFDPDSRSQALQEINRLLKPQGLLFVGSAETGALMGKGFTSVGHPMSFAYRKGETKVANSKETIVPHPAKKYLSSDSSIDVRKKMGEPNKEAISKSTEKKDQKSIKFRSLDLSDRRQFNVQPLASDYLLKNARTLADRGQLQEAANLCQTYLTQNQTSVPAYLLLGEVHQALGDDDRAEECFQKAVYLDPNHYEALTHLALLKEQRGDISNARSLRQRIQRLENQSQLQE